MSEFDTGVRHLASFSSVLRVAHVQHSSWRHSASVSVQLKDWTTIRLLLQTRMKSVSSSTRVTEAAAVFYRLWSACWFVLSVILIRDNPVKVLYCRVNATTWIQTHSSLSDPSLSSSEPRGGCWLTPVQSAQQRSLWLMQTAITTRCCSLFSRLIWCGTFLTPIRRPWLCAVPPLDGVAVLLRFSFLPVQREWMLKCCRRRCYDRPSWGAPGTWGVYRSAGSDGFVPRWKKLEHQNRINLRWVDNGVRC